MTHFKILNWSDPFDFAYIFTLFFLGSKFKFAVHPYTALVFYRSLVLCILYFFLFSQKHLLLISIWNSPNVLSFNFKWCGHYIWFDLIIEIEFYFFIHFEHAHIKVFFDVIIRWNAIRFLCRFIRFLKVNDIFNFLSIQLTCAKHMSFKFKITGR